MNTNNISCLKNIFKELTINRFSYDMPKSFSNARNDFVLQGNKADPRERYIKIDDTILINYMFFFNFLNRDGSLSCSNYYIEEACRLFDVCLNVINEALNTDNYLSHEQINKSENTRENCWPISENLSLLLLKVVSLKNYDLDKRIIDIFLTGNSKYTLLYNSVSYELIVLKLFRIADSVLFVDRDVYRALLWYNLIYAFIESDSTFKERKKSVYHDILDITSVSNYLLKFIGYAVDNYIEGDESIEFSINVAMRISDIVSMLVNFYPCLSRKDIIRDATKAPNTYDLIIDSVSESLREFVDYLQDFPDEQITGSTNHFITEVSDLLNQTINHIHKYVYSDDFTFQKSLSYLRMDTILSWVLFDLVKLPLLYAGILFDGDNDKPEIEYYYSCFQYGQVYDDFVKPVKDFLDDVDANEKTVLIDKVKKLLDAAYQCKYIKGLLKCKSSQKVCYYTKFSSIRKMFKDKADSKDLVGKLPIMHIAYMNDPLEGKLLRKRVLGYTQDNQVIKRQKATYPYVFAKCFTSRIDDLPMWETYGDHARGCCLIIDTKYKLNKNPYITHRESDEKYPLFYNVCYMNCEETIGDYVLAKDNPDLSEHIVSIINGSIAKLKDLSSYYIDDEDYRFAFDRLLDQITYLFKRADYSYEREKRMLYTSNTGLDNNIVKINAFDEERVPLLCVFPPFSIHIEEIVLGPKFKDAYLITPWLQQAFEEIDNLIGEDKTTDITVSQIVYH